MADTADSKSVAARRASSTLARGTTITKEFWTENRYGYCDGLKIRKIRFDPGSVHQNNLVKQNIFCLTMNTK